jgi:hypothetical protein
MRAVGSARAAANNAIDVVVTNATFNTNNGGAFITSTGALNFGPGTSAVGTGAIAVTATGAITQSGAITQAAGAGAASFTTGAAAITLNNPGNDFSGAVSLSNAGCERRSDHRCERNSVGHGEHGEQPDGERGGHHAERRRACRHGDLDLQRRRRPDHAHHRDEQLHRRGEPQQQRSERDPGDGRECDRAGDDQHGEHLTVNAVGITQNAGGITVGGTSTFNAGAGVLTLTTATNDFTGAVSASNSGANAMQITDANAIQLGTVSTANNLTVNAVGITQDTGGITVGGTSTFNAGAGRSR